MKRTYDINVDCANCAAKIERTLSGMEGVTGCRIDFVGKTMTLETGSASDFDDVERRCLEAACAIEDGFSMDGHDASCHSCCDSCSCHGTGERHGKKTGISIGLAGLAVGLAIQYLIPDLWEEMNAGIMLYVSTSFFLVLTAVVGHEVFLSVPRNLRNGNLLDENFLMSLAVLGAVLIGLIPGAEDVFYIEGLAVMVFYEIGESFEGRAVDKSREAVRSLMSLKAPYATVIRDGRPERIGTEEVRVGDVLVVKSGEKVPVDGTVVKGESFMDTKAMTGEPVPRRVVVGDGLLSGFINTNGAIHMRADRLYSESATARVISMIEEAYSRKSGSERFITKFARYYTPAVVAAAAALFLIPPLSFGWLWTESLYKALIFLVVSCPCALVVSVPLTYYCGIGRASRQDILIKGSGYVESLSKIDTVVFDKTGTLTEGVFNVVHVHPAGDLSEEEFLDIAAHAEAFSTHPISRAIRDRAGVDIDASRLEDVTNIAGQGVTALVDGRTVYVGNENLIRSQGVEEVFDCGHAGTDIHVYIDRKYAGHIVISDALKTSSPEAVGSLRSLGVSDVEMLTGDNAVVGKDIADRLGLDGFGAELLPEEKTERLEGIMEKAVGKTAFIGDGINDAPSIARADVGLAMGGVGSDAAVEAADVVIVDDDPRKVAEAIRISKHTQRIVLENIAGALLVKFSVLCATPFWPGMNMWIAILADVGILIAAVFNATRALYSSGRTEGAGTPSATVADRGLYENSNRGNGARRAPHPLILLRISKSLKLFLYVLFIRLFGIALENRN